VAVVERLVILLLPMFLLVILAVQVAVAQSVLVVLEMLRAEAEHLGKEITAVGTQQVSQRCVAQVVVVERVLLAKIGVMLTQAQVRLLMQEQVAQEQVVFQLGQVQQVQA
jgi:hypothetical protein